ncbi:MAG: septum formation initiator family protein [Elusimicrobiaceae bacterium]|nr:septum formation initiator family protein [Elusimicrobiaceae bacterium]
MPKKLSAKQKFILISAIVLGVAVFLLGGSILNLAHNKLELYRLAKKRTQLDAQYEQLLAEKKLLEEQDPKYMEMLARTRYNMVKPGEIEIRLPHD